ncbi:MAG: AMP-binding protein [Desulfovibrio sp.]|nr:AMP-binding protein [Desulfovibrio sp.]
MAGLVTEYLEEAVSRFPGKIAIVDENRQMTYSELHTESLRIGAALAAEGIHGAVAIWLGRTAEHVAAAQGVAYCGCAYVPLDTSMPLKRLLKLYRALQPSAVIACREQEEAARGLLAHLGEEAPRLFIYEEMTAAEALPAARDALEVRMAARIEDDPLCIIFTSGSTGTPKGVVSTHRMLRSFPDWEKRHFGLDEKQIRAGQAPLYMAMGAYCDVYSVLATAGTLLLLGAQRFMFPRELLGRLRKLHANVLFWVPSLYRSVADCEALSPEALPELRLAAFCGEPMPMRTITAWRQAFPAVRFVNLYGSTETNITGFYEVEQDFGGDSLPIGSPCEGREVLLWNAKGSPVPHGDTGEMVVRGPVAKGYLAPGSTAGEAVRTVAMAAGAESASFLPDPEAGKSRPVGAQLFRTGDLARLDSGGRLVYVSRSDAQVKHMGYRIELGEIESAANEVSRIKAAACLYDREKDDLVLFYVADEDLTERRLLQEMSASLPRYMWPTRLERCEGFPATASGKIDRQALKARL